jgi:hypothetical protein
LLLVVFAGVSQAMESTWYNQNFRTTRRPLLSNNHFSGKTGEAILMITNGTADGHNRVSSAKIILNGVEIFGPNKFNQQVYQIEAPVNLEENNWISVELRSTPESFLTVKVVQIVDEDISSGTAELLPTTKIIGKKNSSYLISVSNNGANYVFDRAIESLVPLEIGNILVFDISSFTPSGALRKIISVQYVGNEIIVNTEQASLVQAVKSCNLSIKFMIRPPASNAALQNAITAQAVVGDEWDVPLNEVIYDVDGNRSTTYDQIRSEGNLKFSYEVEMDLVIGGLIIPSLEYFVFKSTVEENADLDITAGGALGFDKKKELISFDNLPVIPVWILYFKPEIGINVGVEGNVNAEMTTGITQNSSFTAGVEYNNSSWNEIASSNNNFDYREPTLSAGAHVMAYAGPQLELLLYGLVGPYTQIRGYLDFYADLSDDPCWELYTGLAVDLGVTVELIDWTIIDESWPGIIDVTFPLDGSPLAEGDCGGQNEPIVITFDNVPNVRCRETWTESGVEMQFTYGIVYTCGWDTCYFDRGPEYIGLYPSQFSADLSSIPWDIALVEVDIIDYCGHGCTRSYLYDGQSEIDSDYNTEGGEPGQTLKLYGTPGTDKLVLSSCEGIFEEIRIYQSIP